MKLRGIVLASLVCCVFAYAQAPSPQVTARQMVNAATVTKAGLNQMSRIKSEDSAEVVGEWINAIVDLTGEKMDAGEVLNLLLNVQQNNNFYANGKFQKSVGLLYAERIKSIPKEVFASWAGAYRSHDSSISNEDIIWYMLRHKKMFADKALNQSAAKNVLARLTALPQDTVSEWSRALGVDKASAASSLISVDSLFKGAQFQTATYKRALPFTKPLIKRIQS